MLEWEHGNAIKWLSSSARKAGDATPCGDGGGVVPFGLAANSYNQFAIGCLRVNTLAFAQVAPVRIQPCVRTPCNKNSAIVLEKYFFLLLLSQNKVSILFGYVQYVRKYGYIPEVELHRFY